MTGFHGLHVLVGLIAMAVLVKVVDQTRRSFAVVRRRGNLDLLALCRRRFGS